MPHRNPPSGKTAKQVSTVPPREKPARAGSPGAGRKRTYTLLVSVAIFLKRPCWPGAGLPTRTCTVQAVHCPATYVHRESAIHAYHQCTPRELLPRRCLPRHVRDWVPGGGRAIHIRIRCSTPGLPTRLSLNNKDVSLWIAPVLGPVAAALAWQERLYSNPTRTINSVGSLTIMQSVKKTRPPSRPIPARTRVQPTSNLSSFRFCCDSHSRQMPWPVTCRRRGAFRNPGIGDHIW